jgi:hypothetical protein
MSRLDDLSWSTAPWTRELPTSGTVVGSGTEKPGGGAPAAVVVVVLVGAFAVLVAGVAAVVVGAVAAVVVGAFAVVVVGGFETVVVARAVVPAPVETTTVVVTEVVVCLL